jgi:hypothetical protein
MKSKSTNAVTYIGSMLIDPTIPLHCLLACGTSTANQGRAVAPARGFTSP